MKNGKILFISNEYSVGGSTVSLKSLIVGMKRYLGEGVDITVLLPKALPGQEDARILLEEAGIHCKEMLYRGNYKRLGQKKTLNKCFHDAINSFSVLPLCFYLKRKNFDIICSNSTAVDVGARAARLAGEKHIYYVREFMEEDHGLEYRNKKRMRKLLEAADRTVFISQAIEKKYKTLYHLENSAQFFDGFVLEDYFIDNHEIFQRDKVKLLQIGRLNDGKGAIDSVEIVSVLKQSGIDNFQLEFVGSGEQEYLDRMNQLIRDYHLEDNITITPYTTKIKEKLSNADILLMNSRSEGFGRVTVEGMLAGCLVLGRNNAGTTELIRHKENGLLYESREEAVDLLIDIFHNMKKYKEVAHSGQKWAVEEFDCKKTAQKFCDFLHIGV